MEFRPSIRTSTAIFPTDFSEKAARAFPQAVSMAVRHEAELHVVPVAEREAEGSLPMRLDAIREWLGTGGAEADLDALSLVRKQVESGVPAERLVGYVEDRDVDLV